MSATVQLAHYKVAPPNQTVKLSKKTKSLEKFKQRSSIIPRLVWETEPVSSNKPDHHCLVIIA